MESVNRWRISLWAVLAFVWVSGTVCAQTEVKKTDAGQEKKKVEKKVEEKKAEVKKGVEKGQAEKGGGVKAEEDTVKVSLKERWEERREVLKEQWEERRKELKAKGEEAMIRADSVLSVRNAKVTTDTLWVARPRETWTFRAKGDMFGDLMQLRAVDVDGAPTNYYLQADPKVTLGVMANYRGVSLSLGLSPTKMLSELSDMMSAVNYYSNTFGVDATFEKVESFRGRTSLQSHAHKVSGTDLKLFSLSGYYVFNGRKFSLPAVFNSTWVQRRSAGSFLVQGGFETGRLRIGGNLDNEHTYAVRLNRVDVNSFHVGAGYGYNLVVGRHWLWHLMAQPSVMVWKNYRLTTTGGESGAEQVSRMDAGHFNVFVVGRLGGIYSWGRYFLGLTSVVQHSKCGRDSEFSLRSTRWQGRAFFGWRVQTKLHERPKPVKRHRRRVAGRR